MSGDMECGDILLGEVKVRKRIWVKYVNGLNS